MERLWLLAQKAKSSMPKNIITISTSHEKNCNPISELNPNAPLEPAWTKLALIARILDKYDWVFWSDADSIILNFDVKLESFIDHAYDLIACTEDPRINTAGPYTQSSYVNTGQFLLKNSLVAKNLIARAWNDHATITPNSWEQARINKQIRIQDLFSHVKVHPGKDFNVDPKRYKPGDFIVHMYAYHGQRLHCVFRIFEELYGSVVNKEIGHE